MVRIVFLLSLATVFGIAPMCLAQSPNTLLRDGTPQDRQKAIEMMTEDPKWVTRRDSESQTPLHVAAQFNHTEVVKWLLDKGADVNAQAYNRFTPLHLTVQAPLTNS